VTIRHEVNESLLHELSPPGVRWTTVNMAEVLPGVLTPLGWTFWREPCESGLRGAFADAGLLPAGEVQPPIDLAGRLTGLFHGRLAGNLTLVCKLCDSMPGSSGAAFEEQVFGFADPDVERRQSFRRYPIVLAKMPVGLVLLPRRLRALRREIDHWWRSATGTVRVGSPETRLAEAGDWLRRAMRRHMLASLFAQACYDQVTGLARSAGEPGLELALMTGYGSMEETRISSDLWAVSRDRMPMPEFLRRHGFHAQSEGQLASRSWREDVRGIEDICTLYRGLPDDQDPERRASEQLRARRTAEDTLIAALPPGRRRLARLTLAVAARYLPLREVGKAAFLQAIDGARAAAREIGDRLVEHDAIDDREDVFFATLHEITGAPPADLRDRIAFRRSKNAEYAGFELPERWTGSPVPQRIASRPDDNRPDAVVLGVAVSPGVVEGRARIVHDPFGDVDFEPGDILVCETTDPSWVVLFQLASAVVIDVGGAMSHGAIVARELGIPAVINTRDGTRIIKDGARIRVDGAAGRVDILTSETGPETNSETRSPDAT
jgi:phosphohistidine swiveling domain-containing protein